MLKRIINISNSFDLRSKNQQLEIISRDTGEVNTVPIEDIGVVVLDNPRITMSQRLISELTKNNVGIVFCDEKHLPTSLLLNLDGNYLQTERFADQISASTPLKKSLWQKTIERKVLNQAATLELCNKPGDDLKHLASKVLSGDTTNIEAQAARRYWSKLFGEKFTRERNGPFPNNWLNYGYAIIRAAMARAIVAVGLIPTLGIHHHNRYNSYCLADDLMEPYRPFVDKLVFELSERATSEELEKEQKREILSLLSSDVVLNKETRPMMIAMEKTAFSVVKVFKGKKQKPSFPQFVSSET
jgi:CRISPR-associated protein Cas1